MLYSAIKSLRLYSSQEFVPLPKGDKTGYDNAVFLLSSSREKSKEILMNKFLAYHTSLFKNYYIDFKYNEKIGRKKIFENNSTTFKKDFTETNFPYSLRMVSPNSKMEILQKFPNILVDLGNWNKLYFSNSLKISQLTICDNYISFIASKINASEYNDYQKILYIDLNDWFIENSITFGLDKAYLNNPVSIILLSIYKYPDLLKKLGKVEVLITDSKNKEFIKLDYTDFSKENYTKVKSRLLSLKGFSDKVSETIDSEQDNAPETEDTALVQKISKNPNTSDNKVFDARTAIINALKKNLVGEVEDITSEYIEPEDVGNNTDILKIESEFNEEIEKSANDYIDENPDILYSDPEVAAVEIEKEVIQKVYISKFMPEYSENEKKKIEELIGIQTSTIGRPSYQDLESKIIDVSDFSQSLTTSNTDIIKSQFKNFDNNYNKKKLHRDIDEAVSILSNAENKIFITGKSEEDSSDQLNLKKTLTYELEDERGRKMKLKLDVPIVIDDKYVYLNGNKKILQHQLVLKPIVKTGPGTVQVVTFYNKIFITRKHEDDLISSSIRKHILSNINEYKVKLGNSTIKNVDVETPIEFDIIARRIYEFTIGDNRFITDIHDLMRVLDSLNINYKRIDLNKNLLLGYNTKSKEVIFMNKYSEVYSDVLFRYIPQDKHDSIKKNKISRLMYSQCTILEKDLPLILFMLFCEGFTSVMKKANIDYKFVTKKEAKEYDFSEYGKIELADGIVVWKRYPLQNSLLMNGMRLLPTDLYTFEELDSKETYIFMLSQFYSYSSMAFNLSQYRDFMIDNVSREILIDFGYPTDLVSLLIFANSWLKDNSYLPENNHKNIRIRSNELIPYFVYKAVTTAYNSYRKTQHKAKPTPISFKQNAIIKLLSSDNPLLEDSSVLNAVLELEKNRAVTYKGKMGINLEQAMGIDKRAYDPTMLGILGISTPDDAGVGILRQLTLEPRITSTRGYLDITPREDVDKLNSANLLTPAELLTPMAVQHDDPARTAIK